jgi:hypothetical protein
MELTDLSWLTGNWRHSREEQVREEIWSEALGGVMVGMTRWVRDGKVTGLELSSIQMEDDRVILRTRHFDRSLADRPEEVRSWKLRSLEEGREAVFENPDLGFPCRVVFRAVEPGHLSRRLEGVREGEDAVEEYPYRAAD